MKTIIGGPDTPKVQAPRATNGGQMDCKPIPYCEPQGPKGIMHEGVGLGGTNHGNGQKPIATSGK
jgi:hypothetical protein